MRLVTFDSGDGPRPGELREGEVVPLGEPDEAGLGALLRRGLASAAPTGAPLALDIGAALAARARSRQDRLHRPELPLARRGAGSRGARDADLLREVRQRLGGARRGRVASCREPEGGLRGRGGVRDRRPLQGRGRGERPRPRGRLHAAQRPVRSRPPVCDAAVDAGQGVRRLGPVRPGAGNTRRGRTSRRDRDRAAGQRRGPAALGHLRPRALDSRRSWPTSPR